MHMAIQLKIKIPKYKYVLHSLSSVLIIPEYKTFNSLIDCFLYAYENCIDFTITFSKTGREFIFKISELLNKLPDSVFDTSYDQYFLGFISLFLTTKERDIFKKKLRSFKNV